MEAIIEALGINGIALEEYVRIRKVFSQRIWRVKKEKK